MTTNNKNIEETGYDTFPVFHGVPHLEGMTMTVERVALSAIPKKDVTPKIPDSIRIFGSVSMNGQKQLVDGVLGDDWAFYESVKVSGAATINAIVQKIKELRQGDPELTARTALIGQVLPVKFSEKKEGGKTGVTGMNGTPPVLFFNINTDLLFQETGVGEDWDSVFGDAEDDTYRRAAVDVMQASNDRRKAKSANTANRAPRSAIDALLKGKAAKAFTEGELN